MSNLKATASVVLGFMLLVFFYLIGAVRLIAEIIGYSTVPEDAAALGKKVPGMVDFFFEISPWASGVVVILGVAIGSWLVISGVKNVVEKQTANLSEKLLAEVTQHKLLYLEDKARILAVLEDEFSAPLEAGLSNLAEAMKDELKIIRDEYQITRDELQPLASEFHEIKSTVTQFNDKLDHARRSAPDI